eukprot:m.189449 g.189449  ORF g.189449 m.189449 type:complete len:184 (+) comp10567_c2_seq3:759-1310(+)
MSRTVECQGDAVTALLYLENARAILRQRSTNDNSDERQGSQTESRLHLQHIYLLQTVLAENESSSSSAAAMPQAVREELSQRLSAEFAQLQQRGSWVSLRQLPEHFVPGLPSAPFPTLTSFPRADRYRHLMSLVEAAASALGAEFAQLEAAVLLERQFECFAADRLLPECFPGVSCPLTQSSG